MNPKYIAPEPDKIPTLTTTAVLMLIRRKLGEPGSKDFLDEVRTMADEDESLQNIIFEIGLRALAESLNLGG